MTRAAVTLMLLLGAAPLAAEPVAIVGGRIHTGGAAGTIERGTVLVDGDRIVAVGPDVAVPAEARTIDATGKVVTAGLFDSLSPIGLLEVELEDPTVDVATTDPRLGAGFDVALAFNPRSVVIAVNRVEGLTRALVAPNVTSGPIAGRAAVVDLGGPGEPIVRAPAALVVALGEAGASLAGGSRASALLRLREAFEDARDYAANRAAWASGGRRPYAPSRLDLEALQPVLRREIPLVVRAHRASDLEAAMRLARELDLRLVVAGAAEGWMVAPALAAAGVAVVLDPLDNLPRSFEALGATLENAARLHRAGVTVAFSSGETHNGRNLKQLAGNAVSYGLPWEAGLAAITAVPAKIWGVGERVGTIEPGKDADLVVWDGDPLEVTTYADAVFIRGRELPRESRQTLLRDRYRTLGGELPPAYRHP